MPERVLVTGAAGVVGTLMRPRLRRRGRVLRLLDLAPLETDPAAGEAEEHLVGWESPNRCAARGCARSSVRRSSP